MNRDETTDRAERSERPDADFHEDRAWRDPVAGLYERRVLEELEAPRFFDPASVRWYRSVFSDHNPGHERDLGDVEFLYERALVVECGDRLAPTRAAVLVFGRPRCVRQVLPRPVIDCQFIGVTCDEWSPDLGWTDRIVLEENLLQTWFTLVERYFRHVERPFSLNIRTMRRNDGPPGYLSFREAVINQLIHQDYGDSWRTPFVRFYRDRTVFWNPGDANVPASELLDRTPKEVRNPLIAAAFRGIGLAEQAGTGIHAIFGNWRGLGHVPPVIRSDEARNEFELSLLSEGVAAGRARAGNLRATPEHQPTPGAGAERAADRGGDRPADPSRADMGSDHGDQAADMAGDHGDQVRGDMDGDQFAAQLSARQRAILEACDVPRSLAELMKRAGVSHRSYFRRKHLKPLLEAGLVRMTNPDNPRAPNQKYVVTDAGGAVKGR